MSKKSRNNSNITAKIAYLRYEDTNEPYGTIAYDVEQESPTTLRASYATAWCNPVDGFVKKVGRLKAAGRLKSERYRQSFVIATDKPLTEFRNAEWQIVTRAVLDKVQQDVNAG